MDAKLLSDALTIWWGWVWPFFALVGGGAALIVVEVFMLSRWGIWALVPLAFVAMLAIFMLAIFKAQRARALVTTPSKL